MSTPHRVALCVMQRAFACKPMVCSYFSPSFVAKVWGYAPAADVQCDDVVTSIAEMQDLVVPLGGRISLFCFLLQQTEARLHNRNLSEEC